MFLPRRLDKFVRQATRANLVEVRSFIRAGKVERKREGTREKIFDEEDLVFDEDTILLCGQKLDLSTEHHTYLMNKPRNVTTTANDPRGKRDLKEWLQQMAPGTFPVGRLDRATTGALLFTTDSDLATALLRPDHETEKLYWLWLNESLAAGDSRLKAWIDGVPMLRAVGRAAQVDILRKTDDYTELQVTLTEGKNRQIRRMCNAADFRLLHLHRKAIGPLTLDNVALGSFRRLSTLEVERLWSAAGGKRLVTKRQYEALERKAQQLREEGAPDERLERWLRDHPLGMLGA